MTYFKNRALFLDRDGVINHDYGYVHRINDFEFIDGIFDLVKTANDYRLKVIVVTNQSGIARGYFSEIDFKELTNWMLEEFLRRSCVIDDVYFSPCHPLFGIGKYRKEDGLRKPAPGMLVEASNKHKIELTHSFLVGDQTTDIEAGFSAGIGKCILFDCDETKKYQHQNVVHADNLFQVKQTLIETLSRQSDWCIKV